LTKAPPADGQAAELLEISAEALAARIGHLLADELGTTRVEVTDVRRTFGGNARRAWSFEADWSGGTRPGPLAGIMLSQAERGQLDVELRREFRLLRGLAGVRSPAAIAIDEEGATIGAPSLVLERCEGTADAVAFLRPEDPATGTALTVELAEAAASLHAFDWREAGLGTVLEGGGLDPVGAARSQVESWEAIFRAARMETHPVLASIYGWLREHVPAPARLSVVHGDYRPGNVLFSGRRITALLDWEMAHVGDPVEDLAWAYRSFWSPERLLPLDDFIAAYEGHGGSEVSAAHLRYYRIFTEAKFATISLRAARSFQDRQTRNLRLADRAATVTASLASCLGWLDTERREGRP
jgi:aminoglycoside phosphotransferase (APT) family kinase protein